MGRNGQGTGSTGTGSGGTCTGNDNTGGTGTHWECQNDDRHNFIVKTLPFRSSGQHLVIIGFSTELDQSSFKEEEGTTKEMQIRLIIQELSQGRRKGKMRSGLSLLGGSPSIMTGKLQKMSEKAGPMY